MADEKSIDTKYEYGEKDILLYLLLKDQIENPVHQVAFRKESDAESKNYKSEIFNQINEKFLSCFYLYMKSIAKLKNNNI